MIRVGRPPRPLFGVLAPGERSTRKTSHAIPKSHIPIIQNKPGSQIVIVDFTNVSVTVENQGPGSSFYFVYFITEATLQTMSAAKQLWDSVRKLQRERKAQSEDGNDTHNL
ncbi:hypothetical protein LCGC14_3032530 [marine sediment metagenome]|uniref:Uncharacterized protein n=1 Tax=marine sediment metagenome TaxID=412755 RepID=A0A0F8XF71_9ZZZZ